MARRPLSRAVTTEVPIDINSRRFSVPVYSIKRNNHANNNTTSDTCCSGRGHHGCGCGCKDCGCRLTHFKDESNCEEYGGEGGRQGMPGHGYDLPDHPSRFDSSSSSVRSHDSSLFSNGSFDNSFEVPGLLAGHHPATAITGATQYGYAASEEEEDGHHAHSQFLSPANSIDLMPFEEDSSEGLIPGLLDNSMLVDPGSSISIDERSLLISEYEPSFPRSATASQIITETGAIFANHVVFRPLRLTPECRHSSII